MSEMIERAAHALFAWNNYGNSIVRPTQEQIAHAFAKLNLSAKQGYYNRTRAIIGAMRNPPDDVMGACDNDASGAPYCADHDFLRAQWNLMLDEALK